MDGEYTLDYVLHVVHVLIVLICSNLVTFRWSPSWTASTRWTRR